MQNRMNKYAKRNSGRNMICARYFCKLSDGFVLEKIVQAAAESAGQRYQSSAGGLVDIFCAQFVLLQGAKIDTALFGKNTL